MQEKEVIALEIDQESTISDKTKAYFDLCEQKLGLIPNVFDGLRFQRRKAAHLH